MVNIHEVQIPGTVRHNRVRETPLPIFITLKIHSVTRSINLVDTLFCLGMCVSYDRFVQLTSDEENGVCLRFQMDAVVCPPKIRHGLFTGRAVVNIDYDPSAATAKNSFHGTGISLMQHILPLILQELNLMYWPSTHLHPVRLLLLCCRNTQF